MFLEFHPIVWSLQADGLTGDCYFQPGGQDGQEFTATPLSEVGGVRDYIGPALAPSGFIEQPEFKNPEPAVSYQWTVADILQAIIDAGLSVIHVREYPYANGCEFFEGMKALPGRRYALPEHWPSMPLMLGIQAQTGSD